MTLSTRLMLAMTALVIATATAVGLLGYHNVEQAVLPSALARVAAQARERATELDAHVRGIRHDVLALRTIPAHDGTVRAMLGGGADPEDGTTEVKWRERLQHIYAGQLRAKPIYRQLRFIGAADGGREIVRVSRSGDAVRVVPQSELQRRGERDYFATIDLPEGAVHVSRIDLARNAGVVETPHVPLLRFAAPVRTPDGKPFGIVMINVDMRPILASLRASADRDNRVHFVNEEGDYLLHPDAGREFGFDLGTRHRWQDEFPQLAQELADAPAGARVVRDARGERVIAALATIQLANGRRIGAIETVSYAAIMAPAAAVRSSGLIAGILAAIAAVLIAIPLARSLTDPLVQMTAAVRRFARGEPMQVPVGAAGEVGVLATAFGTMARDVTEQAEASRRNSEILDKTVDSMADAVLRVDAQGKVLFANPPFTRLFGHDRAADLPDAEKMFDRYRADGVTPLPAEESPVRRALRGENVENFEFTFRRAGETEAVHLVANARPIIDAAGRPAGAVAVYHNVTALKEAERQLRQAQKMEAVGQLTGGIAHDFNNILTVITGGIEILAEGVTDRPELAATAKMVDDAVIRGSDLTHHLLAFARRQPLQPRSTDINTLVIEAVTLLRPTLGEQVEVESMLDEAAWPVLIDPSQLASALINLAVNARDAMPAGGKLMLETRNAMLDETYAQQHAEVRAGPYVMVAVSDTGSGIPAAIRDRVFDPFFTTKEVGRGTGLGLSMVYGFVKQSGGHIKIYSEEGHGTTIRIYLPRAESAGEIVAALPQPVTGGHETILVVEDDALVRGYVMTHLSTLGYTAHPAASAAEALALAAQGTRFDLLFTDVIMSGMNGRELADALTRRQPSLKVLYTSGYTENAIVHHGRLDPGVLLLAKPYRRAELARMLRLALEVAG
jgi:PAS domain S-box-containing protein